MNVTTDVAVVVQKPTTSARAAVFYAVNVLPKKSVRIVVKYVLIVPDIFVTTVVLVAAVLRFARAVRALARIVSMFVAPVVLNVTNVQIGYVKNVINVPIASATMISATVVTHVVHVRKFASAARAVLNVQPSAMAAERSALTVNQFHCVVAVVNIVKIVQMQMAYGVEIVAPVAHAQ